MQSELLHEQEGLRKFLVVLEPGEEAFEQLVRFAREARLTGGEVTAIGAFSEATLKFFDWDSKSYRDIPVKEQVEVASLNGDVAIGDDGEPSLHMHAVLGRPGGEAIAGHFSRGIVRPTLEVLLTETPAYLRRRHDPQTGLALLRPRSGQP